MYKFSSKNSDLYSDVEKSIQSLKNLDFYTANKYIALIRNEYPNSGKPHELLGIYYELQGDLQLAIRHYRAAIALEPTLISASKNLERVCTFKYVCCSDYIDYGL